MQYFPESFDPRACTSFSLHFQGKGRLKAVLLSPQIILVRCIVRLSSTPFDLTYHQLAESLCLGHPSDG